MGACTSNVDEDDVQLQRGLDAAAKVICEAVEGEYLGEVIDGESLADAVTMADDRRDTRDQLDCSLLCDLDRHGLIDIALAVPTPLRAMSTRTAAAIVAAARNSQRDEALLGSAVVSIVQAKLSEDRFALRAASRVALQVRMVAASNPRALLVAALEEQMERDYKLQLRATGLVSGAFETIGAPRHRIRAMHYLSSRDVLTCAAACRVMATWVPRFLVAWHAPRRASDALVLRVATRFPYLAEAAFDGCQWITDAAVVALAAGCAALTSVSLFNCCLLSTVTF